MYEAMSVVHLLWNILLGTIKDHSGASPDEIICPEHPNLLFGRCSLERHPKTPQNQPSNPPPKT